MIIANKINYSVGLEDFEMLELSEVVDRLAMKDIEHLKLCLIENYDGKLISFLVSHRTSDVKDFVINYLYKKAKIFIFNFRKEHFAEVSDYIVEYLEI